MVFITRSQAIWSRETRKTTTEYLIWKTAFEDNRENPCTKVPWAHFWLAIRIADVIQGYFNTNCAEQMQLEDDLTVTHLIFISTPTL